MMEALMISGRFDGGEKEAFLRALAAALELLGVYVLVVEAIAGDDFGTQTMQYMARMKGMLAVAYSNYGQLTNSKFCSFYEVKYAYANDIKIIPLKMYTGSWPPAPKDVNGGTKGMEQNKFVFNPGLAYFQGETAKSTDKAAVKAIAKQVADAWTKHCSSSSA